MQMVIEYRVEVQKIPVLYVIIYRKQLAYIIPVANLDGLSEGYTNNGPERCTIVGAVRL